MNEAEDDRELMQRYQRGDAAAFERLYGRHKGPLYRYCLRQCHDADSAAELFQEVWARVVRARTSYRPLARFTTWLYQVAHSAWVDTVRQRGRRPALVTGGADEAIAAASGGPQAQAQASEALELVLAAVNALPAEQREVFVLRQETDLTLEEIGAATGVNRETVKSRLRYALGKLRGELRPALADAAPGELAGDTP